MSYISVDKLTVGYEGRPVSGEISFEVNKDSYLYIVGENGTGKSTLMKTILGLIPKISGSLVYGDGMAKNEIGYLPQQTEYQNDFPASVWEIVLSGTLANRRHLFFYGREEKKIAKENMELLDIWTIRKKCFKNLSGGLKQRVLLARALCATRKILLLDEPINGLDPKARENLYEVIDRLHKSGIAIIMISHDLDAAYKYATHILKLEDGKTFMQTVVEGGKDIHADSCRRERDIYGYYKQATVLS